MPTGQQLVERMRKIVQDASWQTTDLLDYLNAAHLKVAGGVTFPDSTEDLVLTPPLPDLAVQYDVQTSTTEPFIDLPTDAGYEYQRSLYFVSSQRQEARITVEESHIKFLRHWPRLDYTGDVIMVSIKGKQLYYQGVPASAETLTLWYHRKPDAIANTSAVVVGVPEHLQYDVLCNHAAWKIFNLIEDGLEDSPGNAERCKKRFYEALAEMVEFVGPEDGEPIYVQDESIWVDGW
jgi:hypothetical protein